MTDRELIQAVRRGRPAAFEALYRRHKDAVFRYACAVSGSVADGEDLLQEAFLGLVRNIDRLDAERPVRSYLCRAVKSRHIDRLRSFAGRGRRLDDVVPPLSDASPESDLLAGERLAALREALESLPAAQRDVVLLRVFGDLDYGTIAREEATPVATIRTRYRAAIDKLRRSLGRRVVND